MTTTNRSATRQITERSSLPWVMEFPPRLVTVVIFLTIVVAVAGWRIFRESGIPRINALADEAMAAFVLLQADNASTASLDLEEAEKRIFDFSGVPVRFPRDVSGFTVSAVERRTIRKRQAVGVRLNFEGGRHVLVVLRKENFLGRKPLTSFPDDSLLSGERDGRSFVFWEREDASFIIVSDTDMIQAFKLARCFFT